MGIYVGSPPGYLRPLGAPNRRISTGGGWVGSEVIAWTSRRVETEAVELIMNEVIRVVLRLKGSSAPD